MVARSRARERRTAAARRRARGCVCRGPGRRRGSGCSVVGRRAVGRAAGAWDRGCECLCGGCGARGAGCGVGGCGVRGAAAGCGGGGARGGGGGCGCCVGGCAERGGERPGPVCAAAGSAVDYAAERRLV